MSILEKALLGAGECEAVFVGVLAGDAMRLAGAWSIVGSPTSWQSSHTLFNQPFGGNPPPFYFRFQAAFD